jgi:hypothetical protein
MADIPEASAPAPASAEAPASNPINHDWWQWAFIAGSIILFTVNAWAQWHQTKLNKMQIAEIEKKYGGSVT